MLTPFQRRVREVSVSPQFWLSDLTPHPFPSLSLNPSAPFTFRSPVCLAVRSLCWPLSCPHVRRLERTVLGQDMHGGFTEDEETGATVNPNPITVHC